MKKYTSITLFSLLILASAISCIDITLDQTYIKDGMHQDYQPPSSVQLQNTFIYSADQVEVIQEFGSPTRFTVLFGENNRLETWHFDTHGYTVVFMNGIKTSEKHTIPQYREEMYATTFSPSQFYGNMSLNEIVLSTGQHDFLLSTLESDSIAGRLMHMEGLSVGLNDKQINYVETYPAMTERKLNAADFKRTLDRTSEEYANEGLHEYLVVINMDSEFIDSYNTLIELEFSDEKMCLSENDETYCFLRVDENHYIDQDGLTRMYLILDGFIWNMDDEDIEMEVIFSRIDD